MLPIHLHYHPAVVAPSLHWGFFEAAHSLCWTFEGPVQADISQMRLSAFRLSVASPLLLDHLWATKVFSWSQRLSGQSPASDVLCPSRTNHRAFTALYWDTPCRRRRSLSSTTSTRSPIAVSACPRYSHNRSRYAEGHPCAQYSAVLASLGRSSAPSRPPAFL